MCIAFLSMHAPCSYSAHRLSAPQLLRYKTWTALPQACLLQACLACGSLQPGSTPINTSTTSSSLLQAYILGIKNTVHAVTTPVC